MSENIYDKIVKLLRKAERATGPEAETALSLATKLATEHQVDLATIDTTEGEKERKEEFTQGKVEYSEKSLSVYIQWLLNRHFRVRTCYNRRVVYFVGRKSDVVFAQYLFTWLQDRFVLEWNEEKKKPANGSGRRSAKAFFYGMYLELNEKLQAAKTEAEESRITEIAQNQMPTTYEQTEETMEERAGTISSRYQLAVVEEKDELEKEYYRLNPNVRRRGGSVGHSRAQGIAAGRAAGARTSIPGLPLNNRTRSALA